MRCIECNDGTLIGVQGVGHDPVYYECDSCDAEMARFIHDEITRLRSIVEPLNALLKRSSDGVIIRRRNAGAGVIEYMVDMDDSEHWDDTLPEALAAAMKGATDE